MSEPSILSRHTGYLVTSYNFFEYEACRPGRRRRFAWRVAHLDNRRIPRLDPARAIPLSSCPLLPVRARRASSRYYSASRHRVRRPRATTPSVIDDRIRKASTGSSMRWIDAANARRRRACERATRSSEPALVDVIFSASVEGRRPTRARVRASTVGVGWGRRLGASVGGVMCLDIVFVCVLYDGGCRI